MYGMCVWCVCVCVEGESGGGVLSLQTVNLFVYAVWVSECALWRLYRTSSIELSCVTVNKMNKTVNKIQEKRLEFGTKKD